MGTRNFPTQFTTFVGRDRELVELSKLAETARLLTLTGPGGAGKTRLASALCEGISDRFDNDAWFVDLAPVIDPDLIPSVVATALGVSSASDDITTSLIAVLADEERLILLDNCEHVLKAASGLVGALLQACSGVTIVATSREALGVGNETVWLVPAMAVPTTSEDLEVLNTYDAVRLITDRASMANRNFELTRANARGVVRVIERLDGIPLALELAAAWTRTLTPEQIADRLDDRFRLLKHGKAEAPARHQTLRAAIDWSYELLSERDRLVFDRLSVFRGGFTLEGAEAVCADGEIEAIDVLEALHALVESSLVVADTTGELGRFGLLETIREYAAEKLGDDPRGDEARNRHLGWFKTEVVRPQVLNFAGEMDTWLSQLDVEQDNVRAALAWCLDGGDPDEGLATAMGLESWWATRGLLHEGGSVVFRLLESARNPQPYIHARAWIVLGTLFFYLREAEAARDCFDRCLPLMRESGDEPGMITAHMNIGNAAHQLGEVERARTDWEEALSIARRIDLKPRVAQLLNSLSSLHYPHDLGTMEALLRESLELSRELGDPMDVAFALGNLGVVAIGTKQYGQARAWVEESLAIWREIGDQNRCASQLNNLADIALLENDHAEAWRLVESALKISRELDVPHDVVRRLDFLGCIAFLWDQARRAAGAWSEALEIAVAKNFRGNIVGAIEGLAWAGLAAGLDAERSVRLLGVTKVVRNAAEIAVPEYHDEIRESTADGARASLRDDAFERAFTQGRSQALEVAVEEASALAASILAAPQSSAGGVGFVREGEVWVVTFEDRTLRMQHSLGMQHLATLVATPDREVHALDLVAGPGGAAAAGVLAEDSMTGSRGTDAGDMLDAEARAAYEHRLVELEEELEEAETFNDQGKATMLRAELDALIDELKRATGLGGRSRKAASEAERARLNVQRTIKAAVKRIAEQDRALGRHLDVAVKTGTFCSYTI